MKFNKKVHLYFSIFLAFACQPSLANDIDTLLAKVSIALGNEYLKTAAVYSDSLQSILENNPDVYSNSATSSDVSELYQSTLASYELFKSLALGEYGAVYCLENCPDGESPLKLDFSSAYLRRDALTRADLAASDQGLKALTGKYSTLYSSNTEFQDHILYRLKGMVTEQEKLDEKAREMNSRYHQALSSYVDNSNEIVGIEQSLLKEENYNYDNQTQITNYQSCIDKESLSDQFEETELKNAIAQYDILKRNLDNHFDKVFDISFDQPGSGSSTTVHAVLGWQQQQFSFAPNEDIYIQAYGKWNVKGACSSYSRGDLFLGRSGNENLRGFSLSNVISGALNPFLGIANAVGDLFSPEEVLDQKLEDSSKAAFDQIVNKDLRTSAMGYNFSFSSSYGTSSGNSVSQGQNIGASFSYFSFGQSSGTGQSAGSSQGNGTSGTYELRLKTTSSPENAVGSLIGSFCDSDPDVAGCPSFYIGTNMIVRVPADIGTKKLWLRANDHVASTSNNNGSMTVHVKKHGKFQNYWAQYLDWQEQECDSDGQNCGLKAILENIAYIPNPFQVAKSVFIKKFPEFPQEVTSLILEEMNYLIELKVIAKQLKAKDLSRELHGVRIAACKEQLGLTEKKVSNTKDMIRLYRKLEQGTETKKLILEMTRRFYQEELIGINRVRKMNLDRLTRYFAMAVNSYNYLYQQNFDLQGEPQEYREAEYYQNHLNVMEDSILEITAENDLLNPNRGFVVHQLTKEELKPLLDPDHRNRRAQFRIDFNEYMCRGFNLNDQSRVMIEKVGVLLDLDPTREHLFFSNTHVRNTKFSIVHGSENRFYDFNGNEVEFWMPSQKRKINGYSTRVLVDSDSDYYVLRDSKLFDRASFRKTSFSTTWRMDMLDAALNMYEESDTTHSDPILQGVKFVMWFNSADLQADQPINQCLNAPNSLSSSVVSSPTLESTITFSYDTGDADYVKATRFFLYRSEVEKSGFRRVSYTNKGSTDCLVTGTTDTCNLKDLDLESTSGKKYFYKIRAAYKNEGDDSYKLGNFSNVTSVTIP
jgi:hypothetical protein